MKNFSFILRSPSFEDEDKSRAAALLHFILVSTAILNVVAILALLLSKAGQNPASLSANIIFLLVQIGLLILMWKGGVRLAGFILTLFMWGGISLASYSHAGILNPIFAAQGVIIIIAGLLNGKWAALLLAILSSGFGFWLIKAAEAGKYIQAFGLITAQQTWVNDTAVFLLCVLLIFLSLRAINEARKLAVEQANSLRHSDERYRSLVENAPDTIFTLDQNHQITYLSRSTIGQVESFIGRSVYDLLHPASHDAYRAAVKRVFELGSAEQIEVQNLRLEEQLAWYSVRFAPIRKDGQVVEVTAISTDITAYKDTEEALRVGEARYHRALDSLLEGAEIIGFDWRYLYVNDAVAGHGRQPKEVLLRSTVIELYPGIENTQMFAALRTCMEERIAQHFESEFVFPDGTKTWFELSVQPVPEGIFILSLDITERKRSEEALRASEEQYRLLFEANPHPMVVTDETGTFLAANDAAVAKYGYSREEFVGSGATLLRAPEDPAEAGKSFEKARQENRMLIPLGVSRHRKKDGSSVFAEVTSHRFNYQGQKAIVSAAYDLTERLRAETALRESEARLSGIIESAMDAIITIDENQEIVQFNAAAEIMFRTSAAEIIGQPLIKLIPQRFRDGHGGYIRIFGQAGVTNRHMGALGAISGLRADGEEFPIEASISQIEVAAGKFYTVILRDITERKQAEEALRESEARLSGIIESAMDAIITIDENQEIVQFNAAAEIMFRTSAAEIIGQPLIKLIPERFRDGHGGYIRTFGQAGVTNRHMGALGAISGLRADGEEFPIEASISQVDVAAGKFYTVILRDITQRKQAEDEIRRSEELFSTIFQSVPVAIGIVSLTNNQTIQVNNYTLEVTGYDSAEIVGRPIADAPYWMYEGQWQELSQPIREGEATSGVEMEWHTKAGQRVTMLGSAIQIDIYGEPCLLGLALNITERKQAEQMRLQVYKEHELLELKERFISTMSHEFRTPLAVILSASESLRNYYDRMKVERREEHFNNIEEQVRYAAKLLDDVLTLSKERAGKMPFNPVPMNLVKFCAKLFEQMQTTDSVQHEFSFVTDGEIGEIDGDEKLLQHMLINLLSNAIKYSPEGGNVGFEVRRDGDEAVIQISDQGIGIPEADQKHLFEAFYRASNTRSIKGTGLGLAIVKDSIETHCGTIQCESTPNQGTTFVIRLPITAKNCEEQTT